MPVRGQSEGPLLKAQMTQRPLAELYGRCSPPSRQNTICSTICCRPTWTNYGGGERRVAFLRFWVVPVRGFLIFAVAQVTWHLLCERNRTPRRSWAETFLTPC